MVKRVKVSLTKQGRVRSVLENLGVIGLFLLLHVVAIIVLGTVLTYIDYDRTPPQFKLPTLQRVSIQRKPNGDMYEYFINRDTQVKYLKIGKQWRNAKTGRIVSVKTVGV